MVSFPNTEAEENCTQTFKQYSTSKIKVVQISFLS